MTSAARTLIRPARDARVRSRIQAFIDAGEVAVCGKCGCTHEMRTPGCKTCWDRHYKAKRRDDEEWRREQNRRKRERREDRRKKIGPDGRFLPQTPSVESATTTKG